MLQASKGKQNDVQKQSGSLLVASATQVCVCVGMFALSCAQGHL